MKKSSYLMLVGLSFMVCTTQGKPNGPVPEENAAADVPETVEQPGSLATNPTDKIAPGKAKLVLLADCPQKDKRIRVVLSKDADMNQKAKIYIDGKLLQTIADEEPLFTDWYDQKPETFIHFVDADFDGNTDIFLGLGESRTYSTILLWKPGKNRFERYGELGDPSLQHPVFSAAEKAIYNGGANSAWEQSYSKDVWKNGKLKTVESLLYYDNVREYNSMNGESKKVYNLYDAAGKLIKASNDLAAMPKEWQNFLKMIKP